MITDNPNPPKLLLDEQIWVYLATLLRKQGFDVYHVTEVGLGHTPDPEIFRVAVENHQAVVTFNVKDYIRGDYPHLLRPPENKTSAANYADAREFFKPIRENS